MFATIEDFLFNDYEHESVLPIFIYENNHLKNYAKQTFWSLNVKWKPDLMYPFCRGRYQVDLCICLYSSWHSDDTTRIDKE